MFNRKAHSTDLRLFLPEVIWLGTKHFDLAREMSDRVTGEAQQWQTYLNALALLSFEQWLSDRLPDRAINRDDCPIGYLRVGEFKFWAIATEHLLDELVNIPQNAIDKPERAAHFYVLLEVLEEEEKVILRGFLRYDELVNYRLRFNFKLREGCYQLPLSLFDSEPNHLLLYCHVLQAAAIPLPVAPPEEKLPEYLKETRTKLSQWLQGVFDEAWQAIDRLSDSEFDLAFSTRNVEEGAKRGKLIDLGMQLGNQTFALLVNVTQEAEEKLGILIQLHPTGKERYLPPHLKLTLLSKAGKTLQEVTSRSEDNYIQLKRFKGEPGKRFSIEVSLGDVSVREDFEF
ncbi:MAG TPA: hypothetical protein DCY88_34360 [Cyanobacteria bacterium UBA11372]|nr:hypothetical protein [Cyanobacteria bacterium UBA11372]